MELLPEEKALFEQLKKEYKFEKISRTPNFEKDFKKSNDTMQYELHIDFIDCNKSEICYQPIADNIFSKIRQNIKLASKFYKYSVIFSCENRTKKDTSFINHYEFSKLRENVR